MTQEHIESVADIVRRGQQQQARQQRRRDYWRTVWKRIGRLFRFVRW